VERKKKVNLPGIGVVDGVEVGFRPEGENWNVYLADDGTVIRLKLVATDVVRLEGQYDAQGNPVYFVQSSNIMAISAPENLRRNP
jgi:hypothetical protein